MIFGCIGTLLAGCSSSKTLLSAETYPLKNKKRKEMIKTFLFLYFKYNLPSHEKYMNLKVQKSYKRLLMLGETMKLKTSHLLD